MKIQSKWQLLTESAALLAALLLVAASPSWAQSRGGSGRGGSASIHSPGGHPTTRAAGRIGTALNPNFAPLRGVPGLGFDYQHLAAISRPLRQNRGVRNRNGRTFLTPIFDVGYPYYAFDTGEAYDDSPEPQGPPLALIPPIPTPSESPAEASVAASLPAAPPAPVPELGQLILVRRDGQVVLAVAFTTSSGRLTYITQDGLRRSFPVAELDRDATRQMNDVNGTAVSLPD